MDLDAAREFLREHHRGVLATRRGDGGIQQSPVLVNVDGAGRAIISSREKARIVKPSDVWVTRRVGHERLVLTACNPLYSAEERIVVFARLTDAEAP